MGLEDAYGWRLSVTTLHSGQESFLRGEPDCASLCESQHVSAWHALMPRKAGAETFGSEAEQII